MQENTNTQIRDMQVPLSARLRICQGLSKSQMSTSAGDQCHCAPNRIRRSGWDGDMPMLGSNGFTSLIEILVLLIFLRFFFFPNLRKVRRVERSWNDLHCIQYIYFVGTDVGHHAVYL